MNNRQHLSRQQYLQSAHAGIDRLSDADLPAIAWLIEERLRGPSVPLRRGAPEVKTATEAASAAVHRAVDRVREFLAYGPDALISPRGLKPRAVRK